MRTLVLVVLMAVMIGCTSYDYEGKPIKSYFEDPGYLIKDPHFESYKNQRDALEHQYLNKEITYADYQQQLKEIDDKYNQEIQKRDAIIKDADY